MPVLKTVNKDFFKTWSPEMAYVLGFIFADGYVHENKRGSRYLGFVSTDLEIIQKIRTAMGSNHKIGLRIKKNKDHKKLYRLQIGNEEIWETLCRLGIYQNKSLSVRLPESIPDKVIGDFLRGYFDGDGCVYFKKHFASDRNKYRWVFQYKLTSGSKKFLEDLHDVLSKYVRGGFVIKRRDAYDLCFSHNDARALYLLMYGRRNNRLCLSRKYEKYSFAIKALGAPRSLRKTVFPGTLFPVR